MLELISRLFRRRKRNPRQLPEGRPAPGSRVLRCLGITNEGKQCRRERWTAPGELPACEEHKDQPLFRRANSTTQSLVDVGDAERCVLDYETEEVDWSNDQTEANGQEQSDPSDTDQETSKTDWLEEYSQPDSMLDSEVLGVDRDGRPVTHLVFSERARTDDEHQFNCLIQDLVLQWMNKTIDVVNAERVERWDTDTAKQRKQRAREQELLTDLLVAKGYADLQMKAAAQFALFDKPPFVQTQAWREKAAKSTVKENHCRWELGLPGGKEAPPERPAKTQAWAGYDTPEMSGRDRSHHNSNEGEVWDDYGNQEPLLY